MENFLRIKADTGEDDSPFVLIDRLYEEQNSLSETALQAEHYINNKGELPPERAASFQDKLMLTLKDEQRPEDIRITALNILRDNDSLASFPIIEYYPNAGVRLQTLILETLVGTEATETTKRLLEVIEPTTPKQEQLRLRALGQ